MSMPSRTPSQSARFKSILDDALNKYKQKTGKDLPAQWLDAGLTSCESVGAVLGILQAQAKTLEKTSPGDQKLMKGIWLSVDVLSTVSATFGEGFSLAFPPAKAIVTGISVLLSAAKGVKASHDALVDLFGRIEDFFKRFRVYIQSCPTTEWEEVLVRVVAEVLYILSIATKEMEQGKAKKFLRRILGRTDIEDALRKLDSLIQGEHGMATAQILKATSELKDDVGELSTAIQQMVKNAGDEVSDEWKQIRKDAQRWFSPPDPSKNHNIAWKAYHDGTATWLFEGSVFVNWMSIGTLLWVHGKPGSGKSILCSAIIEHLMALHERGQVTLLYYYFDFRDEEKQNARNLITSLLVQLSAFSDPCSDIISNLYLTHGKGTRKPTDDALTKCLKQMLSVLAEHPIYIIMDALDECPDDSGWPKTARAEVLHVVKDLVGLHFPNLRICVTSRPEVDIKSILNQLTIHAVSLHDEREQQKVIADYVSTIVNSDEKMREWPDEDKELVVKVLSERADGMFRWVVCQLETLRRSVQRNVRGILEKLPKTLDETYERILNEINEDNREHARRLLHCLAVAIRPLRVEELAEILAFDFDGAQGGIPEFQAGWQRRDQEQAVLFTCSSLITVVDRYDVERDDNVDDDEYDDDDDDDEHDDNDNNNDSRVSRVVEFSHFSVKEFLMSNRLASSTGDVSRYHILPGSAHTILAQVCLGILLHLNNPDHTQNVKDFPLAKYASRHWVAHAQFEGVASHVKDGMESLFDMDKPHFAAWVDIYDIDADNLQSWRFKDETQIPTPLYYSALCGLHDLAEHLLIKYPQHVRSIGGEFDSPLLAALYRKHVRVAELLLKHGGDINARGTQGQTPLLRLLDGRSYEDDNNHIHVVTQLLLERGADVNATDEDHQTPLLLAIELQKYKIVRLLLQHGADVKTEVNNGKTPLHVLLEGEDHWRTPEFVLLLLERGADVNAKDKDHVTPLLLAIQSRGYETTSILLQHGAEVKAENNKGKTPLHVLSEHGGEYCVPELAQLLLEHGADVNAKDKDHATSLLLAVQSQRYKNARSLLQHGADVNVENNKGKTPLHVMLEHGYFRHSDFLFALLLLDHGADVNAEDRNHTTPLLLAIRMGDVKVVEFLLYHGADDRVADNEGNTPLHLLSRDSDIPLAQILLERGADTQARDKNQNTPLHVASYRGNVLIAQVLLGYADIANELGQPSVQLASEDHDVYVSTRNEDHDPPSIPAPHRGRHKVAQVLPDHGLKANAENIWGETPLHLVSRGEFYSTGDGVGVAKLLLEHGANIRAQNKDHITPLRCAFHYRRHDIARVLLDYAAISYEKNDGCQTPSQLELEEHLLDMIAQEEDDAARLHLPSYYGQPKIVWVLLEHGADANMANVRGETPLHLVSRGQYDSQEDGVEVARLLLQLDADVNAQDNGRTAPLHLASYYARLGIARVLLYNGANADMKNELGQTPLHLVLLGNRSCRDAVDIVQLLLEHGVDVNAQDVYNETPLQLASKFGKSEIARVLLTYGATSSV